MPAAELSEDGKEILVSTLFTDNDLMKRVPGANFHSRTSRWHLPATWPGCLILRDLFGDRLQVGPQLAAASHQWKSLASWREWLASVDNIAMTDAYANGQLEWMRQLWEAQPFGLYPFQGAGAVWLGLGPGSILEDEPGLGKTVQAIASLVALDKLGVPVRPVLVVCPDAVRGTWLKEFAKWVPAWNAREVTGGAARRREILSQAADVFVINWQALRFHTRLAPYGSIRLKRCPDCGGEVHPETGEPVVKATACEAHPKELNKIPLTTVILDEGHRVANEKSKQTRAAWHVADQALRRIVMTGTPAENSIADLWSLLRAVDRDAFPSKSKFVDMFATVSHGFWGGFEVLGLKPEKKDLYYRVTAPYTRRMLKGPVLPQLPDKMPVQYRYPEMSPKQAELYKQMKEDMIARVDQLIVAKNPLSQLSRLGLFAAAAAQVEMLQCKRCAGGWPNPECVDCHGTGQAQQIHLVEPSSKVDDLVEFIGDDGGRPLVICAESKRLINLATARLTREKVSFTTLTGDVPTMERDSHIEQFQKGHVQAFLFTIAAGSEGITLTRSDTIFYLQHSYSRRLNTQSGDRVHRIGSEGHQAIRTIVSVTPGTVEERKEEILVGKGERFEEIVRDKEKLLWLLGGKK